MPPTKANVGRKEKSRKFKTSVTITNDETGVTKTFKVRIQQVDRINNFRKYVISISPSTVDIEQMHQVINELIGEFEGDITSVNLFFDDEGGVHTRSLDSNYLEDFEDFEERLNTIIEGGSKKYGSDPISGGQQALRFNKFGVNTYSIKTLAFGKTESMLFKVENVDVDKNLCAYECLKKLGYEYDGKPKLLSNLQTLIEYIDENHLPIQIISNVFTLNNYVKDYDKPKVKKMIKDKYGDEKLHHCIELNNNDIDTKKIYSCYEPVRRIKPKYTLIYDESGKHIDIALENKLQLCDNVFVDKKCQIIKDDKIIYIANTVNKIAVNHEKTTTQYVFFDYETIIDFDYHNCMKEYSLSILSMNEEQLHDLEEADLNNWTDKVANIRASCCKTFLGFNCSIEFVKWIMENQDDKAFVFIGFNSSSFDNFFLLDCLLRNDTEMNYKVDNIFYNGSQLLNFTINGRHTTFDIRKHLVGSLKANCNSFKINCCAKKEFDHNKAQQLYQDGELIKFINDNEELKEYNEYDVLATAVLYKRYVNALNGIKATEKYASKIYEIKTIGSLIYKVFEAHTKEKKIKLPTIDYKKYKDLQRSKIAGRVEMFNGIQKVQERIASTDVCSLYPFVMSVLDVYYPCGKIEDVTTYKGDDKLGFYYCDIDQSELKNKNLPNIYAYKTGIENIWNYEGVIENYLLSNVMIGLLKKYGCKVTIRNGFVFTEKKKSCEMFTFLLDIMKEKNKQDGYKDAKDVAEQLMYNPALRETLKLLMNALSGKVIEGLHTEKVADVNSGSEFLEIKNSATSINVINNIGNRVFMTYTVDEESICEDQQRPIYLGVLIYDYAKRYMYENSYSKIGLDRLLYTDTDASKFRYTDMQKWREWIETENVIVPHWKEVEDYDARYATHLIYNPNSKVFGSFEDELEEMISKDDKYTFYCLEKKSWLYSCGEVVEGMTKKQKDKVLKYRFKGLNDNAVMITLNENFIEKKTIKHKDGVEEVKHYIPPIDEMDIEVYNYIQKNPHLKLENNGMHFFEKLYTEKSAYVLVSSFRKIVKNSAREVGIDEEQKFNALLNKIQVNFMLKKISLNSK